MPVRQPRWPAGVIVLTVTLLHLLVLAWARHAAWRQPPRKSEITIELGERMAAAPGPAGPPPAPAATPQPPQPTPQAQRQPQPQAQPQPIPRKPPPVPPVAEAAPSPAAPVAMALPAAAPSPAPAPAPQAAAATPTESGGGGAPAPAARGVDQPVALLNNPKPTYPPMAMLQGVEGTVRLHVLVQPDGSAAKVVLAQSSGDESLDRSALETVARWRFTPARTQGRETAQWVGLPITFSLKRR